MSTLAISVLQGFFLGIVLGVSKHTREHSNVVPQIIALLMELSMKMLTTTVPSWVQCLPSRLVSSSSLHFACVLSTFRPSTWHERPCWVKNWCWRALATRMNCHKSNSILSLWPYVAIPSRPSSTGQQLESLHPAVQVFFLFLLKFWRIKSWSVFSRGMWSLVLQTQRSQGSYRTQQTFIVELVCHGLQTDKGKTGSRRILPDKFLSM